MELGPAEAVGLVGGEGGGDDAVGPGEAALGRLIGGPFVGAANGEDAAVALDHDVAGVGGGRGDEGNAARSIGSGLGADPFGAGAGLAPAAAGEDEPDEPVTAGGDLGGAGPGGPVLTPGPQPLPGPASASTLFLKPGCDAIDCALEFGSCFFITHPG